MQCVFVLVILKIADVCGCVCSYVLTPKTPFLGKSQRSTPKKTVGFTPFWGALTFVPFQFWGRTKKTRSCHYHLENLRDGDWERFVLGVFLKKWAGDFFLRATSVSFVARTTTGQCFLRLQTILVTLFVFYPHFR